MGIILRILGLVFRQHKLRLVGGYVSVLGAAIFALAVPRVLGISVNQMLEPSGGDLSQLSLLALVLLFAGAARGLFAFGQSYLGESVSQRVAYSLRNAYFEKLQHLSFGFHDKQMTGELMSRATSDIEGVRNFISMGAIRAGWIVLMLLGIAVAMLLTDVKLALVSLAFVPILAWQAVGMSRTLRTLWLHIQELQGELVTVLQENLSGMRVVKAFAAEEYEKGKFSGQARQVADETFEAERRWAVSFAWINFGFTAAIGAILWVGGQDVIAGRQVVDGQVVYGRLTPGDLTSFLFYMALLTMPVRMLGWMSNSFSRASSCGERLFEVLDAQSPVQEKADARALGRATGRVAFQKVSFQYDGRGPALREIDVEVRPGQIVALLGRPGSGKTTFAHLIARFYDVSQGRVIVDGVDVRDVTLTSLRDNVGVVQQDVFIHTATLRENIAYGRPDAPFERVVEVARLAQLHDFIAELPDRYETLVGKRGVTLSGGQKQRLSIARTLLRDPPILILDDSTSSVDARTERQLQEALAAVIQRRTTFIITSRLGAIRNADLILVFKDGAIVERGAHEELLALNGEYRELYDSQLRPQEERVLWEAAVRRDGGTE